MISVVRDRFVEQEGQLFVPASLEGHVEALVWSRFKPRQTPLAARLVAHGGVMLIVGLRQAGDDEGAGPVVSVSVRHLIDSHACIRTKPEGCLSLFALLTPLGAMGLMREGRLADYRGVRPSLRALVGDSLAQQLVGALSLRAGGGPIELLGVLAGWLEAICDLGQLRGAGVRLAGALSLMQSGQSPQLDSISTSVGLSRRSLERNMRAWFGTSPAEQDRFARLQRAARSAWRGARAVDVAAEAGFADQAHLSRTIRQMTGLTASCYLYQVGDGVSGVLRQATGGSNLLPGPFESVDDHTPALPALADARQRPLRGAASPEVRHRMVDAAHSTPAKQHA